MSRNLGTKEINDIVNKIYSDEMCLNIIRSYKKRYYGMYKKDQNDLLAAIDDAILTTAENYSQDKNSKISTCLYKSLQWKFNTAYKQVKELNEDKQKYKEEQIAIYKESYVDRTKEVMDIKEVGEKYLDKDSWKAIEMKYLGGYSLEEISEELKCSHEWVNKKISTGISIIKEHFLEEFEIS